MAFIARLLLVTCGAYDSALLQPPRRTLTLS
jgi:hypothetical protein